MPHNSLVNTLKERRNRYGNTLVLNKGIAKE